MGTPAYSNGFISFKKDSAAASESVKNWMTRANNHDFPKDSEDFGDFCFEIGEADETGLSFVADSMREQNLQWQLERLQLFLESIPEVISLDAPIMVQGEGIFWERE